MNLQFTIAPILSLLLLASSHAAENFAASRNKIANTTAGSSHSLPSDAYLQGLAQPKLDASLRPQTQGTITKIHVREGDWVKAGTPLVTIDDRVEHAAMLVAQNAANATAALHQAELAMKQAQSVLGRTEIAYRANASSEFEVAAKRNLYEQATAAYELQLELKKNSEAQFHLAQAELAKFTICAPFDGEVLQIHGKLGNTIDPSEVAVRVADVETLQVEMHLPLEWFGKIKVDEIYFLRATAPTNRVVPSKCQYVSPVFEPTSGTFRASFEIGNPDRSLPAGLELWIDPPSER